MPKGPLRRSQLINPFGVGSMVIMPKGSSFIIAGLDFWYKKKRGEFVDLDEFKIREWRLERILEVDHFRLPPDYRISKYNSQNVNVGLTIPVFRFPRWHVCNNCRKLEKFPLSTKDIPKCQKCKVQMIQVPFVAICRKGHLQDFPWNEWVHSTATPKCSGDNLILYSGAGATLASHRVICNECNARRSLAKIDSLDEDGSFWLSKYLERGQKFNCAGKRPWLGDDADEECGEEMKGSLKSASNVYFAENVSSIFIPLEKRYKEQEKRYTEENLLWDEYKILRNGYKEERDELLVDIADLSSYDEIIRKYFSTIGLVKKLIETRVFCGFSRIYPSAPLKSDKKGMLWRKLPKEKWLPAYRAFGEGIFLEFNSEMLQNWENKPSVRNRILPVLDHSRKGRTIFIIDRGLINPRFIMIHTFSHLLINQLVFECGYSSASLRERLYVSCENGKNMCGILIYTAAGDSEGTMGGLVRMGRPGLLEQAVINALQKASWCSSDPICMEMSKFGQGPELYNLAACHNCSMIPETSCENMNMLLDRGLVIGTFEDRDTGYFKER